MSKNNNFLIKNNQDIINYYYKAPKNNLPIIIFLPGYVSNIKGKKATFFKEFSIKHSYGYLTFDYSGHGESSGDIKDYSLEDWLNDVIFIIDNFAKHEKKILVGSSMGGWLAFLYALRYPELIVGIVGVAPALDFTEDIKKSKDSLLVNPQNENSFFLKNSIMPKTPISRKLLHVSEEFLILKSTTINLKMPIRLVHGMLDNIVMYNKSLEISNKLISDNVVVTLIKNGDHLLSTSEHLNVLGANVHDLVKYN